MNLTELRQAVKEELETKTAINNLTSGKAKEGFKQLQQLFSDAEELQAYLNSEEGPLPLAINAFLEKFGLESDPQHKQIFQFENTFHKKPKLTKTKLKQIIREELKQVLLETKEDYSKILRDLFYQFNSALIEVKKLSDEDLHKDSVTRFYRDLRKIRIKLEDAENVGKVALCTKWKKRAYELSLELLSILDDLEKDAIRNGPNWFFPAPIDYRDVHSKIKKITNALAPSIGPNGEKVFPCGYAVDDSRPRKKSKIYKYNDSLNRKQWKKISRGTLLIDYHYDGCRPCRDLWPILTTVASEFGLDIVKVDITAGKPAWHKGRMPDYAPKIVLLKNGRRTVWTGRTGSKFTWGDKLRDFLKQNN